MVYEFYCSVCEITAEENRRVRDRNKPFTCVCGNVSQRQIGLSNFHLKGSTWAKDGYRSKTAGDKRKMR